MDSVNIRFLVIIITKKWLYFYVHERNRYVYEQYGLLDAFYDTLDSYR